MTSMNKSEYLTDHKRVECTSLNNLGVPQGSLLGSLLFNIYNNDITLVAKNIQLGLYADSTTDYCLSTCPTILQFHTNNDLALFNC